MFKNYIKIAFRNLWKHKVFTLINIVGLGVGMTMSFIILQFVVNELSFDRFHKNGSRIFEVENNNPAEPCIIKKELAPYLMESIPSVKQFVRIINYYAGSLIRNPDHPERSNIEQRFGFVDASFFSVFSFNLVEGSPATVLSRPFCVVISNRTAEKYFGTEDPIGRKLIYKPVRNFLPERETVLEVTGVMENSPRNSSIQFDMISSTATYESLIKDSQDLPDSYRQIFFYGQTFLLLDDEMAARNVERKLSAACKSIKDSNYREKEAYQLEPLFSLHNKGLYSNFTEVKVFSGIAITILLLALFNYINLTTARATVRAREVGVRKTLGVSKLSLMGQFFAESLVIILFAFLLALILLLLFRGSLNELFNFYIEISEITVRNFFAAVMLILLGTALIAGIYPALVLSSFNPVKVLQGNASPGSQGTLIRRTLIVLQFAVSGILILGSIVVQKQISFMRNTNPGYNTDQLLNITLSSKLENKSRILKLDLKNNYGFENISSSNFSSLTGLAGIPYYNPVTKKQQFIKTIRVDEDFIKNVGLKLLSPLNTNIPADYEGNRFVLNETAVKELGLTNEQAVDYHLFAHENVPPVRIAGVVRDFNLLGPKYNNGPSMLEVHDGKSPDYRLGCIQIRLNPKDNMQEKIALIEKVYKKYEPEWPFRYSFTDQDFDSTFLDDLRISKMIQIFTVIAVFLACMGLFGLITFTTQTRTKEIGIRKVLGANVFGLASLLSIDFIKLVIVSLLLAIPLSYYFISKWLQNFPFHVEVSWWLYVVTSLSCIVIAIVTVSFQAIKAASKNPVASLKVN